MQRIGMVIMHSLPQPEALLLAFMHFSRTYGWASANPRIMISGYQRIINVVEDGWTYDDRWYVGGFADPHAFRGRTSLCRGIEVFTLSYHGSYDAISTRAVKAALMSAYSANEFWGGRGPEWHRRSHKSRVYNNELLMTHDPDAGLSDPVRMLGFCGCERVMSADETDEAGYCYFQGGVLANLK